MGAIQPLKGSKKQRGHSEEPGHNIFHVLAEIHEAFAKNNIRPAFATSLCSKKSNFWETSKNVAHKKHVIQKSIPKLRTLNSQKHFFSLNQSKWPTSNSKLCIEVLPKRCRWMLVVQDSSEPIKVCNYILSLCYSGFLTSQLDWFARFLTTYNFEVVAF